MASTFAMNEAYSTSSTGDTNYVNLLSVNESSGSDTTTQPNAHPITVPAAGNQASYERYIRGKWSGTFNSISAVKMWLQSWTVNQGCNLYATDVGSQTYTTAVVPSAVTGWRVNTDWDAEGDINLAYSGGYSDYMKFILWVGTTASAGTVNTWTIRTKWTET